MMTPAEIYALLDEQLPASLKMPTAEVDRFSGRYGFYGNAELFLLASLNGTTNVRQDYMRDMVLELLAHVAIELAEGVRNGQEVGPLKGMFRLRQRARSTRDTAKAVKRLGTYARKMIEVQKSLRCRDYDLQRRLHGKEVDSFEYRRSREMLQLLAEVADEWPVSKALEGGNLPALEADFRLGMWEILRAAGLPRKTAARIIAHLLVGLELPRIGDDIAALTNAINQQLGDAG